MAWLQANFATLIVAAAHVVCVADALCFFFSDRRKGRSCSCGCGSCPYDCKKKD
ncbi:MAG: FeoB-associated Cys-rich membrane protein [Clostridia bacterium]|nr:FeoB-associated Cys-rich membrane protein [Clostridia bacterium]